MSGGMPRVHVDGTSSSKPRYRRRSEDGTMEPKHGKLGILIGALVAAVVILFIATGGDLGGKKTVNSDNDLPPVATGAVDR
ncbi:MAG: hypothetical protein OJF62_000006 [Pseudolabrys sp.]|nr:hypothetical protein [Pseudolabrys sp.]